MKNVRTITDLIACEMDYKLVARGLTYLYSVNEYSHSDFCDWKFGP